MAAGDHSGGLFSSVRRVADTCVSSVHNRVELLSVELQEEKNRLVRLLLWTGAALFAAFLAITVITIAVVVGSRLLGSLTHPKSTTFISYPSSTQLLMPAFVRVRMLAPTVPSPRSARTRQRPC